jgi:hypothetical protein
VNADGIVSPSGAGGSPDAAGEALRVLSATDWAPDLARKPARPRTDPRPWPTFSTVPTGLVTALCTNWIGAEAALASESRNAWLFSTSCSVAIACSSFTRTPSMFTPTTEKLANFDSITNRPK